jgi:hypothetical protein
MRVLYLFFFAVFCPAWANDATIPLDGFSNYFQWLTPAFVLYGIALFFLARRFGATGTLMGVAVRYKPPEDMTLLRAAMLWRQHIERSDLPAAVAELSAAGYIRWHTDASHQVRAMQRTDIRAQKLTSEQRFVLKTLLFGDTQRLTLPHTVRRVGSALERLESIVYANLLREGYVREHYRKARVRFLAIAFILSLPLIAGSLYATKLFFGGKIAGLLLVIVYFLTIVTAAALTKYNLRKAVPFIVGVYVIAGIPILYKTSSALVFITTPLALLPVLYATMWYFSTTIGIRTAKGLKVYRHLLGYKKFVCRVEAPRLEQTAREEPTYSEEALAYGLFFGCIEHPVKDWFRIPPDIPRQRHIREVHQPGRWRQRGSIVLFFIILLGNMLIMPLAMLIAG